MNSVAHLPLVFHNQHAVVDRDPQALATKLAQHFPVREFAPRNPQANPFLHRASTTKTGDLTLTAGYTSPIHGCIGDNPGVGAINICYSGSASYEVDGRNHSIHGDAPLYFNPGFEYSYSTDHYSGLVLHVDLQRPQVLALTDGRQGELLVNLRRAFALLDAPELQASGDLSLLLIDDLIYRILALALCPQLEHHAQRSRLNSDGPSRVQIFGELLEWIQANLHTPISLTQLEQRLDLARQHLLNPAAADTVAGISALLGFRNISTFSRDFHGMHGIRPSDVLREGRRLHG